MKTLFQIPEVLTPRLRLRALTLADLDAYAAICADEEVMRYIGNGGPIGRDGAWRHLAMFNGEWTLHGSGMWGVETREGGPLIGRVGYLNPVGWPGQELGWTLARSAWGQGYALEASEAARRFGRAELGVTDLISMIREANVRSIALAERLGARNTGPIEFLGGTALVFRHPPQPKQGS